MNEADLDGLMDASVLILGIAIQPEWREAVKANLALTFRMGALVLDFPLPDEAEPAPVFTA